MKCVTDVVESSASIDIDPDRLQIVLPDDFKMPEGGLSIRWPDPPLAQEARLLNHKWYAALAYIRANKLNRVVIDSPSPRLGIMTAGKAYLDVRQALADLSLDDQTCARIGIRVLKVGCVWPLDAQNARDFATGLDEILVVEEKRQVLEYALKEELYNWRDDVRPKVFGKFDQRDDEGGEWSVPRGQTLLPAYYELSPALIAKAIARRLEKADLPTDLRARINARIAVIEAKEREAASPGSTTERQPWFCSGCPHNTSTRVPEGSRALAGIGCHYMSMWMDRKTETFSQMGGEGVAWTGQMHFTNERHVFVNLGDGTYFHSGLLAIRASIAAGANVTYKVLYNDAVAMTGGQPVDGVLTVPQIAFQVVAEGAKHVLIVTDEPEKYDAGIRLPEGVQVYHRDELDRLQRELREMAGTSILIYDQTCATEKRRRRKRGTYPDPATRAFINDAVCEGCGDCSVQSNCLSVEPLQTSLGTKRKINQSSCNKDFSCVNGFCPSFVTAEGAQVKKPAKSASATALPDFAALPRPVIASLARPYGVLVTGVGGTGVVTIGGLLGMAAHLENKGVTVLDMAGLAQKGGAVLSHVQIAAAPDQLHATRIAAGEARLILGCDAIVSASAEVLARTQRGITKAAINSGATPTAKFVRDPQWTFPADQTQQDLRASIGDDCDFIDANRLALALLGDTLYANPLLLGFVWQRSWLPLGYDSLDRAIELNGVAVEKNRLAFEWGRYIAEHGEAAADAYMPLPARQQAIAVQMPESLDRLIERNIERLSVYQNPRYAARYVEAVERLRAKETAVMGGAKPRLTQVAARNLAKLMTYKDEYEVARLFADPAYMDKLRAQFEGEPGRDYKLAFHLAPPLLAKRDEHKHLKKRRFGQWTLTIFRVLQTFRFLRGTAFDVFGKTQERRTERELIEQYFELIDELCATLDTARFDAAMKLANLPDEIRGFGHVKERNVAAAAARRERWLAEYRIDAAVTAPASTSQPFEKT
jgi:indolepyruvate ferredoxin oxidoreductase